MKEDNQLLVDSIKEYAIFMLDPAGNILTWNKGAERSQGYRKEEVIGKHFSILFTEQDRFQEKPQKLLQAALEKGHHEEESWRVKKDGTKFWANIIIEPVYDGDKHVGFARVTRDLTEKRRNEELYLLLVNQVQEYAIFMLDKNGDILTWNAGAERINGYRASEVIGKNFALFYTSDDQAANVPQQGLETAIRKGKFESEGWRYRKDGSRFWANVVINPVYTDSHIGFATIIRDMTEAKEMDKLNRANAILETTNKELERFAFTASHDLKEPLRKITIYANLLMQETKEFNKKNQAILEKICNSSQRLWAMIDDILDFSNLSLEQHFEKYLLDDILKETLERLEETIKATNAEIVSENLPPVIIIPGQMRQLFQNLIGNSLKFAKKDESPRIGIFGRVIPAEQLETMNLRPSDQYLEIRFRDNGIGFDQEYAEGIFTLFNRLHSKSVYEGSGLGLALCKKIADNHGGVLTATSSRGKGAEFRLLIPA